MVIEVDPSLARDPLLGTAAAAPPPSRPAGPNPGTVMLEVRVTENRPGRFKLDAVTRGAREYGYPKIMASYYIGTWNRRVADTVRAAVDAVLDRGVALDGALRAGLVAVARRAVAESLAGSAGGATSRGGTPAGWGESVSEGGDTEIEDEVVDNEGGVGGSDTLWPKKGGGKPKSDGGEDTSAPRSTRTLQKGREGRKKSAGKTKEDDRKKPAAETDAEIFERELRGLRSVAGRVVKLLNEDPYFNPALRNDADNAAKDDGAASAPEERTDKEKVEDKNDKEGAKREDEVVDDIKSDGENSDEDSDDEDDRGSDAVSFSLEIPSASAKREEDENNRTLLRTLSRAFVGAAVRVDKGKHAGYRGKIVRVGGGGYLEVEGLDCKVRSGAVSFVRDGATDFESIRAYYRVGGRERLMPRIVGGAEGSPPAGDRKAAGEGEDAPEEGESEAEDESELKPAGDGAGSRVSEIELAGKPDSGGGGVHPAPKDPKAAREGEDASEEGKSAESEPELRPAGDRVKPRVSEKEIADLLDFGGGGGDHDDDDDEEELSSDPNVRRCQLTDFAGRKRRKLGIVSDVPSDYDDDVLLRMAPSRREARPREAAAGPLVLRATESAGGGVELEVACPDRALRRGWVEVFDRRTGRVMRGDHAVPTAKLPAALSEHAEYEPVLVPAASLG